METKYQFMLWFACSLVGTYVCLTLIPNKFLFSFAVAIVMSVVAIREKEI